MLRTQGCRLHTHRLRLIVTCKLYHSRICCVVVADCGAGAGTSSGRVTGHSFFRRAVHSARRGKAATANWHSYQTLHQDWAARTSAGGARIGSGVTTQGATSTRNESPWWHTTSLASFLCTALTFTPGAPAVSLDAAVLDVGTPRIGQTPVYLRMCREMEKVNFTKELWEALRGNLIDVADWIADKNKLNTREACCATERRCCRWC